MSKLLLAPDKLLFAEDMRIILSVQTKLAVMTLEFLTLTILATANVTTGEMTSEIIPL